AILNSFPVGTGAFVIVGEDYIGSLVIRITDRQSKTEIIEIQVVAPETITSNMRVRSFGNHIVLAANRLITAAPFRDVDGSVDVGKVVVFNHSDEGNVSFNENVPSPLVPENGRIYFGTSIAAPGNKNLFAGSKELNAVYRYTNEQIEGFKAPRYLLREKITMPNSVSFGIWVQAYEKTLVAGDADINNGAGAVYFFDRAEGKYSLSRVLEAPEGFSKFGRRFFVNDSYIFVSARKPNDAGANRGHLLVYDLDFNLVQDLAPAGRPETWGKRFHAEGDKLFVSSFGTRDNQLARGQLRYYKIDQSTGLYEEVQRLVSPTQPDDYTQFSKGLALAGDYLFVGAPLADSPAQEGSGIVHYYKFDEGTGEYGYVGPITPSFEKFSAVERMGRSIVASDTHVFFAHLGSESEGSPLKGDIYSVPLPTD
ncbi:MAG: hypothetical protein HRT45_18020, partial [Bdellovibrionales bacterium]|nr:hypothetical protein [Bdellovibrionales bacterium]